MSLNTLTLYHFKIIGSGSSFSKVSDSLVVRLTLSRSYRKNSQAFKKRQLICLLPPVALLLNIRRKESKDISIN